MGKSVINFKDKMLNEATIELVDNSLLLTGDWSCTSINENYIYSILANMKTINTVVINAYQIGYFDTTGALFITKIVKYLEQQSINVTEILLNPNDKDMYQMISNHLGATRADEPRRLIAFHFMHGLGFGFSQFIHFLIAFFTFLGQITTDFFSLLLRPQNIEFKVILDTVLEVGIKGIWIVCLLCFLIGVTLTYQMSIQFTTYGANIYVVNFLGIALLKEVTPLLAAVIVAGRSGSAITASIGTMKVQEEIDALQTMGISPLKRLVLPRIIGMMIVLPLLTAFADIASMLGGMLVANSTLGIDFALFINRVQSDVSIYNYTGGIMKSVAFAFVIGLVACFCGFNVRGSSESVGRETTKSVVLSIFLIVFIDAVFAIIFQVLGI